MAAHNEHHQATETFPLHAFIFLCCQVPSTVTENATRCFWILRVGPSTFSREFLPNVCCNNLRKPSSLRHLARRRKALVYVSKVGVRLWWQKDCECQVCLHGMEIQAEHGTHDTGSYLGQVIWNPEAVGTLSTCSLNLGRQKHCWLVPQKGTASHPGDCFSSLGVASLFHFR